MIKISLEKFGKNIDFDIDENFRVAILGENGIGKSTILKSIVEKTAIENWLSVQVPKKMVIQYFSQIEKNDFKISGGEHTKQRLEKLFASKADLYVLDEPTNNLDQENIQWLKDYLIKNKVKFIFTSHNIDFIDEMAEVIFYLDSKSIEKTNQKCSLYLESRKQKIEKEFQDYELSQRNHERLLGSARLAQIEFEAGIKWENEDKSLQGFKREMAGKFGGATVKRLAKRAEQFNVTEPEHDPIPRVRLQHNQILKSLLEFKGLALNKKTISLNISSGDKLIISGPNGIGKTTLIEKIAKYLSGQTISPDDYFRRTGRIKYLFLSQNWYEKIENEVVSDYLMQAFSEKEMTYKTLSYNHIEPKVLNQKFSTLSPGIRIKILLGLLSHNQYDLIIWDEPTNHLDVMTQYILHQAFVDYQGALILITHDKKLLEDKNFSVVKLG